MYLHLSQDFEKVRQEANYLLFFFNIRRFVICDFFMTGVLG